jgi:hypothetical protein
MVLPVTSRCERLSWGFLYRSAHAFRKSPHTPDSPIRQVKGRIQDFSSSFRSTPPPASQVYFTPLTPIGFALQGFPLPRSRTDSSSAPCRRAVLPRLRSHLLGLVGPLAQCPHSPRSGATAICRLHGLAPLESPFRKAPAVSESFRPCPSWDYSSPGSAPPAAMPRLVTVAPPMCSGLRSLRQVTPTVRPPAALRSITRLGGGLASLEAAFPS